jgi:hypothetical protein
MWKCMCRHEYGYMRIPVTVMDDLLNTKLLSPVSRWLSQPVQSANYMQCELAQRGGVGIKQRFIHMCI